MKKMGAKKVVELNRYISEEDDKKIIKAMKKAGYKLLKESGMHWVWIEK